MTGQEILDEVRFLINDSQYTRYTEINRAYRKILRITNFNFLRVTSESLITVVAGQAEYTLDLTGIRRIERIWVYGTQSSEQHWQLMEEAPPQLWEEKKMSITQPDGTVRSDKPNWYKIEGTTLSLTPTPDAVYSVRVDYIQDIPTLARESEPLIPRAYHDLLADLAASDILSRSKDPIDVARSQQLKAEAMSEFDDLVGDVHPNRTYNIDRKPITWIK